MAMLTVYALLAIAALAFVALGIRQPSRVPAGLRRVPGPRGLPLIGNTHQLGKYAQQPILKWARQYGELFQIRLGWENWVFLNSPAAVKEILDKQSAATSARVPQPVLSDIVSDGNRFLLMGYTPTWRKLRAIVHKLLTPKMSDTFRPSQEFEAKQLLYDILRDSETGDTTAFYMHVRRYSASVVLTSTYGLRVPKWDCEEIREIYGLMKEFSESAEPGAFLADTFPPLAKLPLALQWWRPRARRYYERQQRIWMKFWSNLTRKMRHGNAPECFVKQWVETEYEKQGISEVQAAFVAGTMIEAGSETTSSSLNTAIKYLAAFPDVQKTANEEITRVIGDGRVPTFSDYDQLPYIRALVKEVLRIRPVTTVGTPHYTTADIVYKDYFIPKNTVVSLCQYSIHYDPALYPNPKAFEPARFLNHPEKAGVYAAIADPYQRDHFDFGAGRRICPGMHLAENSLFITLAKVLWAFKILPPEDEAVDVSDEAYEEGANTVPKPYRVRFISRNKEREGLVKREWEEAETEGFWLGKVKVEARGVVV